MLWTVCSRLHTSHLVNAALWPQIEMIPRKRRHRKRHQSAINGLRISRDFFFIAGGSDLTDRLSSSEIFNVCKLSIITFVMFVRSSCDSRKRQNRRRIQTFPGDQFSFLSLWFVQIMRSYRELNSKCYVQDIRLFEGDDTCDRLDKTIPIFSLIPAFRSGGS